MATVQQRLKRLKKQFGLTTSDLSVMMSFNRSTVHYWEAGVRKPYAQKLPEIEKRLKRIEKVEKLFPVPDHVTQYQRKSYLLDALHVGSSQLSKSSTTAKR